VADLVERRRSESGRSLTYHLTEAGAEFLPLVGALGVWGQRWTRRELNEGEIDLGLLIWGLEYSVDPTAFGPGRNVSRLDVSYHRPATSAYCASRHRDRQKVSQGLMRSG
jgi:hypothetical protein